MIFSIQHNSVANSIMRNLKQTGFSMGKSMEKLASGYRINTAADGPSDLIASERLRSRIESLEKAIQNVRTSGNIMDITDGALGEIQNIIQSMRKLALHSMNSGVANSEQIAANQAELDAGLAAIDRIISTTNFAGRKLLENLNLGGKCGIGGAETGGGRNPESASGSLSEARLLPRDQAPTPGTLNPNSSVKIYSEPVMDENGTLPEAKTFTIVGRDGNPENVETISFAAGATLDEMVAKLREYAISPETAATPDPDHVPPAIRTSGDVNQVTLDLGALAHVQSLGDAEAAGFLADFMKNHAADIGEPLFRVGDAGGEFDVNKLSEADRALYELSRSLSSISMTGLGATEVVIGQDANGNDVKQTVSLQDLYSGGIASLSVNPDATLSVLDQANKDVSRLRADLAAKRKYAVEADENVLFATLESYTSMESFLRDTDYPSEMTQYVRSKVFFQVGMRMLTAAMESNKAILSLLA